MSETKIRSLGHRVAHAWLVMFFVFPLVVAYGGQGSTSKEKTIVGLTSVSLSALQADQATVTISTLQDPLSPVKTALRICQSDVIDDLDLEAETFPDRIRKLCHAVEAFTRSFESPTHKLKSGDYVVTVPLREPEENVHAVLWRTKTLDEAITFVELLQDGKLKAVTIYAHFPSLTDPNKLCAECPIKDLVLDAGRLKERKELFGGRANQ